MNRKEKELKRRESGGKRLPPSPQTFESSVANVCGKMAHILESLSHDFSTKSY